MCTRGVYEYRPLDSVAPFSLPGIRNFLLRTDPTLPIEVFEPALESALTAVPIPATLRREVARYLCAPLPQSAPASLQLKTRLTGGHGHCPTLTDAIHTYSLLSPWLDFHPCEWRHERCPASSSDVNRLCWVFQELHKLPLSMFSLTNSRGPLEMSLYLQSKTSSVRDALPEHRVYLSFKAPNASELDYLIRLLNLPLRIGGRGILLCGNDPVSSLPNNPTSSNGNEIFGQLNSDKSIQLWLPQSLYAGLVQRVPQFVEYQEMKDPQAPNRRCAVNFGGPPAVLQCVQSFGIPHSGSFFLYAHEAHALHLAKAAPCSLMDALSEAQKLASSLSVNFELSWMDAESRRNFPHHQTNLPGLRTLTAEFSQRVSVEQALQTASEDSLPPPDSWVVSFESKMKFPPGAVCEVTSVQVGEGYFH